MPLIELPISHIGRNGLVSKNQQNLTGGDGSSFTDERSPTAQTPVAVQGMLKTTTETGDLGRFATKPTRIPLPLTKAPPRRTGSLHNPVSHQGRRLHLGPSRGLDRLDRQQSSSSNHRDRPLSKADFMHGVDDRGPSTTTTHKLAGQDYRSYSLTQSSHKTRTFCKNRSYANLKRHGDPSLIRPRSPFAYPTRLKRPGYRPSSPALSDFNGSDVRTRFGMDRKPSFRTSSPSSYYAHSDTPDSAQSVPARAIAPSPSVTSWHRGTKTPPLAIKIPKQGSTPSYSSTISSVLDRYISYDRSSDSTSRSPRYYDYTEAFEEQETYHNTDVSTRSLQLIDQTIPEDRPPSVQYELDVPNPMDAGIAELSADEDFQPATSRLQTAKKPFATPGGETDKEESDREPVNAQSRVDTLQEADKKEPKASAPLEESNDRLKPSHRNGVVGTPIQQSLVSRSIPRWSDVSFDSSSSSMQNLDISSSRVSLRQFPDVPGASKVSKAAVQERLADRHPFLADASEMAPHGNLMVPSLTLSRVELTGTAGQRAEESGKANTSFDEAAETHTTIYAPVPRRSLSLRSHRTRFSRILPVDDGLNELAEVITNFEAAVRHHTPDQSKTNTVKADNIYANRPLPRSPVRFPGGTKDSNLVGVRSAADLDISSVPGDQGVKSRTSPAIGSVAVDNGATVSHVSHDPSTWTTAGSTSIVCSPEPPETRAVDNVEYTQVRPPLPRNNSIRSFSPPAQVPPTDLPYSFVPFSPEVVEASNIVELEPTITNQSDPTSSTQTNNMDPLPKYKLKLRAHREFVISPSGTRPWNLEESYPWIDWRPSIDLCMPDAVIHRQQRSEKTPKFKLRLSKASTAMEGVVKPDKISSPETDSDGRTGPSPDLSKVAQPAHKSRFGNLLGSIRASTSSDSLLAPRLAINAPPHRPNLSGSTYIEPLSPAEVRSFFSDDSSQIHQKGSIRQRLSEFKARLPASRAASTDDVRVIDRIMTRSAMNRSRASGKVSNQSESDTVGISSLKCARLKAIERVRGWWQRSTEKVRDFGDKLKRRNTKTSSGNTNVHTGV